MAVTGYIGDDLWNGLLWKSIFPVFFVYGHWWMWQLYKSRHIMWEIEEPSSPVER